MDFMENEGYRLLIQALISLENEEECKRFLDDLMTRKELADIAQRMLVVKMLSEQSVYNRIVEETGASTATISRVHRAYLYGTGGYAAMLAKLKEGEK